MKLWDLVTRMAARGGDILITSITPTRETDIVVDGDMEAAGVTAWGASGSPTTREKSGAQVHGGSQALHVITDATGEGTSSTYGSSANKWHLLDVWGYVAAGDLQITQSFGLTCAKNFSAAAWTQLLGSDLCTGANPRLLTRSYTVAASEYYVDDAHIYPLTMASCFANPRTSTPTATVSAAVTSIQQCRIGVAANVDNPSNPQNYVLAVVIKESTTTAKAWLYQVSGGVYTVKINGTAVTYADDGLIEIRHTAETTYQLWYRGSQVGTDQTISDANINNNTTYMQFSTYEGCLFSSFTLAP